MKYIEIRRNVPIRIASLALMGALTFAPMAATTAPAQAQGSSRYNNATVTGTVIDSGNRQGVVRIRQSNGRVVTAYTNNSEQFRVGDTVQATGRLLNDNMRNATVRRISSGWGNGGWGNNNNNNTTISGTVVDSGNQVNVVRIQSNGRIYTAQTNQSERFRVGDYVQATGWLRGSTLSNATVRRTGTGNGNWGGNNNNQNATITGTVVDSHNQANVVRIRSSNGRTYVAHTGRSEQFRVGDTVEARGRLQGSSILNATVRRIGSGSNGYNTRINITGVVVDSGNQTNILRVRATDGITYTVATTSAHRFRVNERVRVTGQYDGSVIGSAVVTRN